MGHGVTTAPSLAEQWNQIRQLHLEDAKKTCCTVPCRHYLEEPLQIGRLLVTQIEEAVARMMSVQAELGAERTDRTSSAHEERPSASGTEFILALTARKVHATATSQGELEAALGTTDSVLGQVLGQSIRLEFVVVLFLPLGEFLARNALVLLLPLKCSIGQLFYLFIYAKGRNNLPVYGSGRT